MHKMPGKQAATRSFSAEEISLIETRVSEFAEANPDVDMNDIKQTMELKNNIAKELGIKPIQLTAPFSNAITKITGSAEPKEKSKVASKSQPIKRNIEEAPSGSDLDADAPKAKTTSTRGRKPQVVDDDDDDDTPAKSTRRQPRKPTGTAKIIGGKGAGTSKASSTSSTVSGLVNKIDERGCTQVDGLPYNASTDLANSKFRKDTNVFDSFADYATILVPSIAEDLISKSNDFIDHINGLHDAYPTEGKVESGKSKSKPKVQVFKFARKGAKKTPTVTYVNPEDLKIAEFKEEGEFEPIIEFHEYVDGTVAKKMKLLNKPKKTTKKAEADADAEEDEPIPFDYLAVLQCNIIYTHNIFAPAWLKKQIGNDELLIKPLNVYLNDISIDDTAMAGSTEVNDLEYVQLFSDIARIPTSKMTTVAKAIYTHRHKLLTLVPKETKRNLWFQALNNILVFTDEEIANDQANVPKENKFYITPEDPQIIKAWQALLRSRQVYHIVMDGVPESPIFNKCFVKLFTHPTSIRLFMTALYPIAFVFTPFHLYVDGAINVKSLDKPVTTVTYNKNIKEAIKKLITEAAYKLSSKSWVFYTLTPNQDTNAMIKLLGPYVNAKPSVKKPKKATDESGNASEAFAKGDASEDEQASDENNEEEEQ